MQNIETQCTLSLHKLTRFSKFIYQSSKPIFLIIKKSTSSPFQTLPKLLKYVKLTQNFRTKISLLISLKETLRFIAARGV